MKDILVMKRYFNILKGFIYEKQCALFKKNISVN